MSPAFPTCSVVQEKSYQWTLKTVETGNRKDTAYVSWLPLQTRVKEKVDMLRVSFKNHSTLLQRSHTRFMPLKHPELWYTEAAVLTAPHFPAHNPWSQSVSRPKAAASNQLLPSVKHEASQNILYMCPLMPAHESMAGLAGCMQVCMQVYLWGRQPH